MLDVKCRILFPQHTGHAHLGTGPQAGHLFRQQGPLAGSCRVGNVEEDGAYNLRRYRRHPVSHSSQSF
ncbi:hypothetical protein chiPu_0013130 [Chiloscyllium punctatum]|uniref:Uncharacterized protein n=1 Tax=Chiloscyllium punctatum TaxID=137246 RepID=A0A401SW81_CHIPU|nr:hypothetical protein [Chiloscyllium punctatum]